jgi:broad specificity phosphatase PhoE
MLDPMERNNVYVILMRSLLVCLVSSSFLVHSPLRAEENRTTVILIRHAEKLGGEDPALSGAGITRAESLARILRDLEVDVLIASQFRRTQQTLEPLARLLGKSVEVLAAERSVHLVERIRSQHRGQVVVVATHSNLLPEIVELLGAGPVPPIAETEYDNLYIVTLDGVSVRTLRLHY